MTRTTLLVAVAAITAFVADDASTFPASGTSASYPARPRAATRGQELS